MQQFFFPTSVELIEDLSCFISGFPRDINNIRAILGRLGLLEPLKMGEKLCVETFVPNYNSTLRKIPKQSASRDWTR